jgi:DNA-binding transcriptional regulator GbsR (MarR family)
MIFNIIFYSFLSFLIIFILHNLYIFFKDNLTTPKIRDLVDKPSNEYKKIYEKINNKENQNNNEKNMKDELKKYMKNLNSQKLTLKKDKENEIQSFNGISGFSEFDN